MYFGMNDKERLDVPKVKTDTTLCAAYILDQISPFLTYLNTPIYGVNSIYRKYPIYGQYKSWKAL